MERLSDKELMEIYRKAKELKCSQDFIQLLFNEINKRKRRKNETASSLNRMVV